ncbi:MAG: ABC transporter permease [Oscillibacter sp.]|nr:ABC transporter permease [Oscillibacter sp.]
MNGQKKRVIYGALGIFIFLCIWYAAAKLTSLGRVMPDPVTVFGGFFRAFVEPIGTKTMALHILISLRRMLIPYAIGGFFGVLVGVLMGWYKTADAIFMPYIQMLRPIPPIAWIPLSIIWFGFDEGSKYFLIFLACFFTIALTTYNGVHSVDETLIRAAKMLGAKDSQLFTTIVLPTTVPYIFSGLQVALGSAWATIVAAEMIRSSEGVGWLIVRGQDVGNMTQIMIGIVAIALTGLLITTIMRGVESKLCAWTVRGK